MQILIVHSGAVVTHKLLDNGKAEASIFRRGVLKLTDCRNRDDCGTQWFEFVVGVNGIGVGFVVAGEFHSHFLRNACVCHSGIKAVPQAMKTKTSIPSPSRRVSSRRAVDASFLHNPVELGA